VPPSTRPVESPERILGIGRFPPPVHRGQGEDAGALPSGKPVELDTGALFHIGIEAFAETVTVFSWPLTSTPRTGPYGRKKQNAFRLVVCRNRPRCSDTRKLVDLAVS